MYHILNHKAPWLFWQKKNAAKRVFLFFFSNWCRIDCIWQKVFFKKWLECYQAGHVQGQSKVGYQEKNPTIACITAYKNGRRVKYINKTKTICTTTCFYLIAATPAGLPGKAITWPLTPREHLNIFLFQKHTYFQAYKLFTIYYPAKLRKYTVAACWDFFPLQKKKSTLKPLKSTGKQLKIQAPT